MFNLQIIERDGRDYVIDLNPRFYASLTLAESAGLNMPAIWASLMLGLPFEDRGYRAGARFRDEKIDPRAVVAAVRRGEPGAARALLPRRGTAHAVFSRRRPAARDRAGGGGRARPAAQGGAPASLSGRLALDPADRAGERRPVVQVIARECHELGARPARERDRLPVWHDAVHPGCASGACACGERRQW